MLNDAWNTNNNPPMGIPQYPSIPYEQPDLSMYFTDVQDTSTFYPNQYFHEETPSPIITDLAQQYLTRMSDALYERQLLEPYGQFSQGQFFYNAYM